MASVRELSSRLGMAPPISGRAIASRFAVGSLRDAVAAERIQDLHRRTGGIFGPLGPSQGPLNHNGDGSYVQDFQLGEVTLADTDALPNAVQQFQAEVTLAAVHCFGTQDNGTDETYAVVSVVSVDPDNTGTDKLAFTARTSIQDNVRAGDTLFKSTTLGLPVIAFPGSGILIHVAVWDHESGNADDIADKIHAALNDAASKGASALAGAAAAGDPQVTSGTVGDITQFEIGGIRPFDVATLGLAKLLAGLFADDLVGEHTFVISAQQVKDLADPTKFNASLKRSNDLDQDVLYNWPPDPDDKQPLLTDGHGSYKAYFTVRGIQTTIPISTQ